MRQIAPQAGSLEMDFCVHDPTAQRPVGYQRLLLITHIANSNEYNWLI